MKSDTQRLEQNRNSSAEKVVHKNNSSSQDNKDQNVTWNCEKDSALHTISLFETAISTRREEVQDNI